MTRQITIKPGLAIPKPVKKPRRPRKKKPEPKGISWKRTRPRTQGQRHRDKQRDIKEFVRRGGVIKIKRQP